MTEYVEQRVTHGDNKWKWDVYAHMLKASFYHSEILDCKENPPKLCQLKGCRDWMHAVQKIGVPGVVSGKILTAAAMVA